MNTKTSKSQKGVKGKSRKLGSVLDSFGFEFSPPYELLETKSDYIVKMDIPGITKESCNVEVHEGEIIVSGERFQENLKQGERVDVNELKYGPFERSIALHQNANENDVTSKIQNGVLEIKIGKKRVDKNVLIH